MPRPAGINDLVSYDKMSGIPSNIGDVLKGVSAGAGLVSQAAHVYMDIQDAAESVDRATSGQARTVSEAGLNINNGTCKAQRISSTTPVGHSSLVQSQTGIGHSQTQVAGNNTAPPVRMTLGKQLHPKNSIENFLFLMNQSGTVSVAFGGRIQSKQDTRVRSYNIFRHNLHTLTAVYDNGNYPVSANL